MQDKTLGPFLGLMLLPFILNILYIPANFAFDFKNSKPLLARILRIGRIKPYSPFYGYSL